MRESLLAAEDLGGRKDENWTTRWAEGGGVIFCFDSEASRDAFSAYLSIVSVR